MRFKSQYIIIPLLVAAVLGIGSIFSMQGMAWYDTQLILPALTPPKWTFRVVWTVIGLLTALSIILFSETPQDTDFKRIVVRFLENGSLNMLWTIAFFGYHHIGIAFFIAVALELNLILVIYKLWSRQRLAALLLLPYALWVLWAIYLNGHVWLLNR